MSYTNPFGESFPISKRHILYEKKGETVDYILWREPDGRVHLQILYKNFQKPRLVDYPCESLGNGRYKCKNITIDTKQGKATADITISDALQESPLVSNVFNQLKNTAIKTVVVGVITGVSVYFLTKLLEKAADKLAEEVL